jgi:hypothetical protein
MQDRELPTIGVLGSSPRLDARERLVTASSVPQTRQHSPAAHHGHRVLVNFTRSALYSRHERYYDRIAQEYGKKARRLLVPRQGGKESRKGRA